MDLVFHSEHYPVGPGFHTSSGSSCRVSFNLDNEAAGYVTPCSASSPSLADFFGDEVVWSCADAAPKDAPGSGTFRFNLVTRELEINQTWTCAGAIYSAGDEPYVHPLLFPSCLARRWLTRLRSSFKAQGSAVIPLHCNDTVNARWTAGQMLSQRAGQCSNATFPMPWAVIMGIVEPPPGK